MRRTLFIETVRMLPSVGDDDDDNNIDKTY